jgi:phage gp29-like protein
MKEILRDLKFNEQGFLITPSDTYPGKDGEPTNQKLVSVKLISSEGTRNIDIDTVVKRYQHDIARSVLAEFIMLGGGSNGSYALSKSKSDLFLRALESYINTIVDVLNKQLIEPLWRLNGLDFKYMPKIKAGDVASHDLKEMGAYLRNLNGASITVADDLDIVNALMEIAELPKPNPEIYAASRERAQQADLARTDYYDGPDDNVVGSKDDTEEDDDEKVGN